MHGPQCCRAAFLKLYQLLPQSIYRAHRVLCNQGPDNQGNRCGSRAGGLGLKRCSVPSQPIGPTSSPSLSTIAHSQVKHSADSSSPSGTARQSWVMFYHCWEPVRNSAHDKGHEEGGLAYANTGSSLRSPPGYSRASPPKKKLESAYCIALCSHL